MPLPRVSELVQCAVCDETYLLHGRCRCTSLWSRRGRVRTGALGAGRVWGVYAVLVEACGHSAAAAIEEGLGRRASLGLMWRVL
jgi:hypothetical protein